MDINAIPKPAVGGPQRGLSLKDPDADATGMEFKAFQHQRGGRG
jgi:hypothetical protein